ARTEKLRKRIIAVSAGGKAPLWPEGKGKRIYAYLKGFPALPQLLQHLKRVGNPTLIFVDGVDRKTQERFASPSIRFETEPLDLRQVSSECDVAILNGTHNTACTMLLAGKPSLQLPLF